MKHTFSLPGVFLGVLFSFILLRTAVSASDYHYTVTKNLAAASSAPINDVNTSLNAEETKESELDENSMQVLGKFEEKDREFIESLIKDDKVKTVVDGNGNLYITDIDNNEYFIEKTNDIVMYMKLHQIEIEKENISSLLKKKNKDDEEDTEKATWDSGMFGIVFFTSTFGFMCYLISRRKAMLTEAIDGISESEDGRGKIKIASGEEIPIVKFDDVEGIDELKKDIYRLVNCLKNTDKYKSMGARIPKGVILYGPPGTGKTLIAKAIAGEAGVPFYSAVGSDFIEKYVGVGAQRIRDLYKKAKKTAPCIVFIDEIDAVAGQRSSDSNSERDQTINALLSELDGFGDSSGIITICATNRLDLLDSAFKRAGRFDLKLAVGLPDRNSRYKILKIHGKNKRFAEDVDLDAIAGKTIGFSGAELEALLNEAALLAADREEQYITYNDIDDAFFKIIMQGNKKKRSEVSKIQYITAYHEAGHALATKLLTNDSVPSVTIVQSSSGAGGVTFRAPSEEGLQSKEYIRGLIKVMYAGRAAEEVYLGDTDSITTGASNDIKQATGLIKEYLGTYGMGDIGMLDISQFSRDFKDIIEEASALSKELYQETLDLLKKNKTSLIKLAEALVEKETLNENEIDKLIIG